MVRVEAPVAVWRDTPVGALSNCAGMARARRVVRRSHRNRRSMGAVYKYRDQAVRPARVGGACAPDRVVMPVWAARVRSEPLRAQVLTGVLGACRFLFGREHSLVEDTRETPAESSRWRQRTSLPLPASSMQGSSMSLLPTASR